jgi:hypothetical protein
MGKLSKVVRQLELLLLNQLVSQTQLTLRTFHLGGTSQHLSQSQVETNAEVR